MAKKRKRVMTAARLDREVLKPSGGWSTGTGYAQELLDLIDKAGFAIVEKVQTSNANVVKRGPSKRCNCTYIYEEKGKPNGHQPGCPTLIGKEVTTVYLG